MRKLDYTILELMESTAKNIKAQPVNLGGVSGSAGGAGGPPGGFIGWLPQTRVAYDIDEIASSGITSSGTLLDNLNHIRYRLQILEAGTLIVDELDGIPTASGVNHITFSGGATVTDLGGGHVIIGITASGGGGGIPEAPSDGNVYGRRNAAWADLDTYYVPYAGATADVDLGAHNITTGDGNSLGNTDIKQGKNIHLGTSQSDNNYIGFGDGDIFGPYVKLLEIYDDCFGVRVASTTGAVLIAGYRSDYSNIETMLGDIDAFDHGNFLKINENGAELNCDLNLTTGHNYTINGSPIGGGNYVLIEAKDMNGGDAASFDFTSIPATYRALKLIVQVRSDRAANSDKINIKINNDGTASHYQGYIASLKHNAGYNTEEFLGTTVPMPVGYATGANSPASTFAEYEYTFTNYANTNMNKDWQGRGGGRFNTTTGNIQMFDSVGHWISTTAINQITFTVNLGTNFKQYSTAYLYGIT